ncbi:MULTISPECIES: flippase [Bacillus]|jgi:O-antigen/teichoic acid export membrane protein|uniref:Flippase n=1 Tax=Bacillus thuringiensis subsp. tolworthi TaxID=1442 RepID=A0A9W3ZU86_BACTO|nr:MULTISPECIES: flippase [Bacillus cereus group]MCU7756104.1 flippase [Bacillus cereus]MDA1926334.1 flippase [Bacillus cereus]MDC7747444.1 flippase [Bacillus cereus]MEB8699744.1 flippase [Bacillus cereus]MEB8716510.1 flippase [Bacillus cereus]
MNNIKKFKGNKFTSNTIWLISEKIFQLILGLVVGIWTARYLGPSNYGILNYGASFIAFFSVICSLGLENVIIKYFVDYPRKNNIILFSAIIIRFVTSIISILAIYLIVSITHYDEKLVIAVITLQSLALIFNSLDTIDYWFQSRLMSMYVVIAKSVTRVIVSIWKVYLLISNASLQLFALSSSIEAMILGVILLVVYFKKNPINLSFSKYYSKELFLNGYHFILSGLLVTIFTQMDRIMLGNLIGQESVGVYSVASNIATLWYFVPLAVINSARPIILKMKQISIVEYQEKLKQLYAFIFWLGLLVSLFITVCSNLIIQTLYGQQYIEAAIPLAILIWASVFSLLGTARNIWIVSEGVNKYTKYYFLIGMFVNFVLNYIFINYFGVVGSAVATLIAQIITTIVAPLFFAKTRESTYLMSQALMLKGVIPKRKAEK